MFKSSGSGISQFFSIAVSNHALLANLQDRIFQFSSHIGLQYMLDVLFGCIYNKDKKRNDIQLNKNYVSGTLNAGPCKEHKIDRNQRFLLIF